MKFLSLAMQNMTPAILVENVPAFSSFWDTFLAFQYLNICLAWARWEEKVRECVIAAQLSQWALSNS